MDEIEQVIAYYEGVCEPPRDTWLGQYVAADLRPLRPVLEKLVQDGEIHSEGIFLDTGSGDGRVVALAAAYGVPAVGIEEDEDLVDKSQRYLRELDEQGALRAPVEIVEGNFMDDVPYTEVGEEFSSFSWIFNFMSDYRRLAEKIATDSPSGTAFLLYKEDDASVPPPPQLECVGRYNEGEMYQLHLYKSP